MRGLYPLGVCFLEFALLFADAGFDVEVATSSQGPQTGGKVLLNHQTPTVGTGSIIGNFYRIEVSGVIEGKGGKGELRLDGGDQHFNDFGDRIRNSAILSTTKITFELDGQKDPTGRGRKVYQIKGEALPKTRPRLLLVVDEREKTLRLVVKDDDKRSVLPLTPRE